MRKVQRHVCLFFRVCRPLTFRQPVVSGIRQGSFRKRPLRSAYSYTVLTRNLHNNVNHQVIRFSLRHRSRAMRPPQRTSSLPNVAGLAKRRNTTPTDTGASMSHHTRQAPGPKQARAQTTKARPHDNRARSSDEVLCLKPVCLQLW